jgi:hypothetical protein
VSISGFIAYLLLPSIKVSVTKAVGFEELKEKRASCKMVIAKSNQMQGARHGNCGTEITGCQAKDRSATQNVSILWRRNVSALGSSEESGERYPGQDCEGISLSLLCV